MGVNLAKICNDALKAQIGGGRVRATKKRVIPLLTVHFVKPLEK